MVGRGRRGAEVGRASCNNQQKLFLFNYVSLRLELISFLDFLNTHQTSDRLGEEKKSIKEKRETTRRTRVVTFTAQMSQNQCIWDDINTYKKNGDKAREKTRPYTLSCSSLFHAYIPYISNQRRLHKCDAFQALAAKPVETALWCILRRAVKCQVSVSSNYCEPASLFGLHLGCDRKLRWFYCQEGTKIHLMFAYSLCFVKMIK